MTKILAIDDEPLALKLLEVCIAKIPGIELLASCKSAKEAEPWLDQADALLVDINMPDINGMDFVRGLEEPPLVIFTTAYSEYAVEGFRVNAVDYLLKPFSFTEFKTAMDKLQERLDYKRHIAAENGNVLSFTTALKTVKIESSHIRYIEGMGEYLKIHMEGEDAPRIILYRMKNIARELPENLFLRIHKSYIIATNRVVEARRNSVILDNGTTLPISETYRDEVHSRLFRFCGPCRT